MSVYINIVNKHYEMQLTTHLRSTEMMVGNAI